MRYRQIYQGWQADPEAFWMRAAQAIDWVVPPVPALNSAHAPLYEWYSEARVNTCWYAVDRHVEAGRGDTLAIIHDSPVTGVQQRVTFGDLQGRVARLAGVLRARGIKKGDRVIIYMPMVPEALEAMLACARLGAIHSVVFGGFAAAELAARIDDCTQIMAALRSLGLAGGPGRSRGRGWTLGATGVTLAGGPQPGFLEGGQVPGGIEMQGFSAEGLPGGDLPPAEFFGPAPAPSGWISDLALRTSAVKSLLDNLAQGLSQIGHGLTDRRLQDQVALVAAEADRARRLLEAILADLLPRSPLGLGPPLTLDGSLQRLMELAGPQMAQELVERLGADLDAVAQALRAAGAAGDWTALGAQSHILIALAGAAGAPEVVSLAKALNRIAQKSDLAALRRTLPDCLGQIAALCARIGQLVPRDGGQP